MKKLMIATLSLALLAIFLLSRGQEKNEAQLNDQVEASQALASTTQAAPLKATNLSEESLSSEAENNQTEDIQGEAQRAEDSLSSAIIAPKRYFPDAKIMAKDQQNLSSGDLRIRKVVETKLSEPYVIVEELFHGAELEGNLFEQSAMVANQLLIETPIGISEDRLSAALYKAGASELKKMGKNFLATFAARPDDPWAVEKLKAAVKESADFELTIAPNYIRKIF